MQPAEDLKESLSTPARLPEPRALGIDIRRVNESLARNQLLPQLNFVGSYEVTADLRPQISRAVAGWSPTEPGATAQLTPPGWCVGVPLTFTEGRAAACSRRAPAAPAIRGGSRRRLEQDIAVSVAHAGGEIETTPPPGGGQPYLAYQLAQQALENEIKKLQAGHQQHLLRAEPAGELVAGAESSLYNALADQRRAAASYDHELGTTLARSTTSR